MEIPLQITFRGIDPSPAIENSVREHAVKLEEFHDAVTGCRVIVETKHRHHRKGKFYRVRIDLTVPGSKIAVSREPERDHAHEDVYVAIRDAFDAARRRLQDQVRRVQREVKLHEESPHGRVIRVFEPDNYGFIESSDGREVYFHRNAVLDDSFERLTPGAEVWFVEEQGDRGPQASAVRLVHKHHPASR
jgi:cold shock CspA family protein